MDRLREKLKQASEVNQRIAKSIEDDADALIAREQVILDRKAAAFKPHHEALDARMKELDSFEDSLQILENADPFADTGDTEEKKPVDATLENAVAAALGADASQKPGS